MKKARRKKEVGGCQSLALCEIILVLPPNELHLWLGKKTLKWWDEHKKYHEENPPPAHHLAETAEWWSKLD